MAQNQQHVEEGEGSSGLGDVRLPSFRGSEPRERQSEANHEELSEDESFYRGDEFGRTPHAEQESFRNSTHLSMIALSAQAQIREQNQSPAEPQPGPVSFRLMMSTREYTKKIMERTQQIAREQTIHGQISAQNQTARGCQQPNNVFRANQQDLQKVIVLNKQHSQRSTLGAISKHTASVRTIATAVSRKMKKPKQLGPQPRNLPFQQLARARADAEVATKFTTMADRIEHKIHKPRPEYPQYDYSRPFSSTASQKTMSSQVCEALQKGFWATENSQAAQLEYAVTQKQTIKNSSYASQKKLKENFHGARTIVPEMQKSQTPTVTGHSSKRLFAATMTREASAEFKPVIRRTQGQITSQQKAQKSIEVIKSHGINQQKGAAENTYMARSVKNLSKEARRQDMGSFGLIPGPIDSVSLTHPERTIQNKNSKLLSAYYTKGRVESQVFCSDQDSAKPATAKKLNLKSQAKMLYLSNQPQKGNKDIQPLIPKGTVRGKKPSGVTNSFKSQIVL